MANAENDLLANIKAYELGTLANVQTAVKNGAITDKNTLAILNNIPYVGQILQLGKIVTDAIVNGTGAGSFASRMATVSYPLSGNLLTKPIDIVKALFSGRTYNSDQYYGASDYSFYVIGKDVGNSTNVKDSDVLPAMKWYVDKTGIFISGSAEINALRKSIQDYMNIHNANPYITMDADRVTAARSVVVNYMPYNHVLGSWKNAVGVYDNTLIALAKSGYTDYQAALQAAKQGYQATNSTDPSVILGTTSAASINKIATYIAIAIIVIIIIKFTLK